MSSDVMERYVMVGGTGRCGTSLTKRILGAHPEVFAAPEFRFTVDPDGLLSLCAAVEDAWSPFVHDVAIRRLESLLANVGRGSGWATRMWSAWASMAEFFVDGSVRRPRYLQGHTYGLCREFPALAERLVHELREHSYEGVWVGSRRGHSRRLAFGTRTRTRDVRSAARRFLEELVDRTLEQRDARWFAEDNTWNILWFDRMQELFPGTRLVHVYRDPRDVVLSYTDQKWSPADLRGAARMYGGIMERWREVRERVNGARVFEVRYEDLLADPEAVTEEICDFAGLTWQEQMVLDELDPSRAGRWRRELDPRTASELEEMLEPELQRYGYGRGRGDGPTG